MSKSRPFLYQGAALRAVAMPLGGLGTGSVALCGDGGLRQWQILNNVNHKAHLPHSFFGLWCCTPGGEPSAWVLMSDAYYNDGNFIPSASVSDHQIPEASRHLLASVRGLQGIEFVGQYPVARLTYRDSALPVHLSLEAWSPFHPLEVDDSALPAVVFKFAIQNCGPQTLRLSLLAALQNAIGWDGLAPIVGVENPGYGGNENLTVRRPGWTAVLMSNPRLPSDHPSWGTMVLAALDERIRPVTHWNDLRLFWEGFRRQGWVAESSESGPSDAGRTWNGALAVPFALEPGEACSSTFLLCWHFPNRYVDWEQTSLGLCCSAGHHHIGNRYAGHFDSALAVAEYMHANLERLGSSTCLFHKIFFESTLPPALLDAVSSPLSIPRSPTCFWAGDGHFYGFEGCRGASTREGHTGGCCPLNCTHVWNYALSLARVFPELERDMREVDLLVQMSPDGAIPHRTLLPLDLPRPWGLKIGGPDNPALDGELGTVLKVYREVRQGAGRAWHNRLWPAVQRLMAHVMNDHDADGDGVIKGEQPNTYDIAFYGANSFIGILYLAALRAAEEMARLQGEPEEANRYQTRFEQGRQRLDTLLWNGEYYTQEVDLRQYPEHQYGQGCHADQLFGQWWAHVLDLGYLLPEKHVKTALQSIMRYNWRENLVGFRQQPRVFADDGDAGLVNCTWPRGGRPAVPTPYSDEIWTGIEYEVAALLLWQGLTEAALQIIKGVRARYDGTRRSPWNEVECGDHYVRAMSSWALLEAASGYRYDAWSGTLAFGPRLNPEDFRTFFITAKGWGSFAQRLEKDQQREELWMSDGVMEIHTLAFRPVLSSSVRSVIVTLNGAPLDTTWQQSGGEVRLTFQSALTLPSGSILHIGLNP